jgi:hypothetical protein
VGSIGVYKAVKDVAGTPAGILESAFVTGTFSAYSATTITLYDDISLTASVSIPNVTITLEGAGTTMRTIDATVDNYKLTVDDNSSSGLVIGNNITVAKVDGGNAGTLTVQGSGKVVTSVEGDGATITVKDTAQVTGTMTTTGGTVNVQGSAVGASLDATGGTITVSGGSSTSAKLDKTAGITVSGGGSIDTLQLTGTDDGSDTGNTQITVTSGWTGTIGALNFYAAQATLSAVKERWVDHTVLAGTVNATVIDQITAMNFVTNAPATTSITIGTGSGEYYIDDTNGKLTAGTL